MHNKLYQKDKKVTDNTRQTIRHMKEINLFKVLRNRQSMLGTAKGNPLRGLCKQDGKRNKHEGGDAPLGAASRNPALDFATTHMCLKSANMQSS